MFTSGELASAVRVSVAGPIVVNPIVGEVSETVGGTSCFTVTATGADVVAIPKLSVATAVSVYEPAATAFHVY